MTFEARDSAAKIVPARFRSKAITPPTLSTATSTAVNEGITPNGTTTLYPPNNDYRQRVSSVTHSAGKNVEAAERQTITQSFIQFSKNLQNSIDSGEYLNVQHPHCATLKRSPSAPTLLTDCHQRTFLNLATSDLNSNNEKLFPMLNADIKRLQVNLLPRQAISVDNPHDIYHSANSHCVCNIEDIQRTVTPSDMELEVGTSSASVHQTDSEASMTMDLHLPDCSITITVKDESKRPKHYGSSQECPSSTASQSSEVMLVPSPKLNSKVADRPSAADLGRRETNRRRPLLRQSQVEHGDSDTESNTKEEDENKDLS